MNIGERERKRERGKPGNRPLPRENRLRVTGGEVGRGWVKWVMEIKEGTCHGEHCVLYVSDESLNSTLETDVTLLTNWNLNKNLKQKNKLKTKN